MSKEKDNAIQEKILSLEPLQTLFGPIITIVTTQLYWYENFQMME